jgi:hypothetical protein
MGREKCVLWYMAQTARFACWFRKYNLLRELLSEKPISFTLSTIIQSLFLMDQMKGFRFEDH